MAMEDEDNLDWGRFWDYTMAELDTSTNCFGMGRFMAVWLQQTARSRRRKGAHIEDCLYDLRIFHH